MAKSKKNPTIANYKDNFVKAWPTKKATAYSDEDRNNGVMLHPDVAARFESRGFVVISEEKPEEETETTE